MFPIIIAIWCLCPISVQEWAVFGEQRGASGGFRMCSLHKWATLGASHLTLPTMKCVQVSPNHTNTANAAKYRYAYRHMLK